MWYCEFEKTERMKNMEEIRNDIENVAEGVVEATKEIVTEAVEKIEEPEIIESMDDYAEELEASLRRIYPGDVMECTVVAFDEETVSVDLDYYAPGKIPVAEMSEDPQFSVFSDVQIGDKFKAVVTSHDDGVGNILLSKKEADAEFSWEKLEKMKEAGIRIKGSIADTTKDGAIMYVEGIRGFIPASKLALKYVEDTSVYQGKKIEVMISEVDRVKKKLILSAKEILTEKALEEKSISISHMQIGTILTGTVEKLMNYGAFVDIGNDISGLVHISEICDRKIAHPKAALREGQQVQVMITKIENGKLSLSIKQAEAADLEAEEEAMAEEASEYKSEYVPNNPFAALLKDIKLK